MACDQTQLLSPYLDGELSGAEAARVEAHAASCPACRAELDELRALARLMSAARSSSLGMPGDDVMARLRAHVDDLVDSTEVVLLRLARVFSAVAACLIVGGLWLVARPAAQPAERPVATNALVPVVDISIYDRSVDHLADPAAGEANPPAGAAGAGVAAPGTVAYEPSSRLAELWGYGGEVETP